MHRTTSTLSSKHLAWLVLTVIATGMSPLKQQSWQDCRIFSLWSVRQATPFIMHLLLPSVPQTQFPVHYGTDGSQAGACCQRQSSFSSVQMFFNRIHRWIWSFPFICLLKMCAVSFCNFVKDDTWRTFSFSLWKIEPRPSTSIDVFKMGGFLKRWTEDQFMWEWGKMKHSMLDVFFTQNLGTDCKQDV